MSRNLREALPGQALFWLMAGFVILLLPQWERLPLWLEVVCALLVGWRWLAHSGRIRLPGRPARLAITLLLAGTYAASVSGRFTMDTAASFFVLTVAMKWLETRTTRDFYVLFFILVYLVAVNFLFRQEILWSLLNFLALGFLLTGLQVVNAPDLPPGFASGWRRLGALTMKSLPFVVLIFLLFPRMGPLWSVPLVSSEARSGLSDSMRPGDISSLAQSDERVFRAVFGGEAPPHRERYWRGLILDYLDGETWRQSREERNQPLSRLAVDGGVGAPAEDEYDILMEPSDQRWAYALEGSEPASANVYRADAGLIRFRRPADTPVRYRLRLGSHDEAAGSVLSQEERRRYLQLPATGNHRARHLARTLAQDRTDAQVVAALLERFRQQPYFYTLRPPPMPVNSVDALLFDEQRGFCAHYASATAFVLRAAGIPARIVMGYQGGESGAGDYFIVRQYDAHAWVEAWLQGRGWVRVDPTAAIAPARIDSGLREAVEEEGSFLEQNPLSPLRYDNVALLRWASLQLDRINYQWQRWVVGYQGQTQMNLMSWLPGGASLRELGYLTAAVAAAALLLVAVLTSWRSASVRQRDAYLRLLASWQELCRDAGIPVQEGDTPAALAERLGRRYPQVAAGARSFARMLNNHYYNPSVSAAAPELRRMRRALSVLRRQLRGKRTETGNSP